MRPGPALAAAVLTLVIPASAAAVAPGPEGEIAYICNPPTPAQLCAIGPDGNNRRLVLSLGAGNGSPDRPAWSADGNRIAFLAGGLGIVNADGTDAGGLGALDVLGRAAWSPDGSWLAVVLSPSGDPAGTGDGHVYKVHPDGSGLTDLTPTAVSTRDPDWSPDGQRIVFDDSNPEGGRDLYTVSAGGGPAQRLTMSPPDQVAVDASWSPDGTSIAFTRRTFEGDTSWIAGVGADGQGERALTSGPLDDEPTWSPAGGRVVYDHDAHLWITGADGAHQVTAAVGMSPSWGTRTPGTTHAPVKHYPKVRFTRLRLEPTRFYTSLPGYLAPSIPTSMFIFFHSSRKAYGLRERIVRVRNHRVYLDTGVHPLSRGLNHLDFDGTYLKPYQEEDFPVPRGRYRVSLWPVTMSGHRLGSTISKTFTVLGSCLRARPHPCFPRSG